MWPIAGFEKAEISSADKRAVKIVNEDRKRIKENQNVNQRVEQSASTGQERVVKVDLKKLVSFISAVISVTMDVKSKSERIQVIAEDAKSNLEVRFAISSKIGEAMYPRLFFMILPLQEFKKYSNDLHSKPDMVWVQETWL